MASAETTMGLRQARSKDAGCRVCGCTDDRACPGGCWWVTDATQRDLGLDPAVAPLCSTCARRARRSGNRVIVHVQVKDPAGLEEWQEAVDQAEFFLHIDSARKYGLIDGGPEIDADRCDDILKRGHTRGIVPSEGCVERLLIAYQAEVASAQAMESLSAFQTALHTVDVRGDYEQNKTSAGSVSGGQRRDAA